MPNKTGSMRWLVACTSGCKGPTAPPTYTHAVIGSVSWTLTTSDGMEWKILSSGECPSRKTCSANPFNIDIAEPALDATRFEGGSWGVVSIVGAKAALEYALKQDQQERYHRILKVTDHLIDGLKKKGRKILTPLQSERRSGIVVFEDEDPQATFNKLKSLNITVASRVKAIRVSPHYYNTEEEIDKLLIA